MIMNSPIGNTAYDPIYLDGVKGVTNVVFYELNKSEYDTNDAICAYMRSNYRKKMDEGNYICLTMGHKELMNGIDFSNCKKNNDSFDGDVLKFLADAYVFMQYKYCIPSSRIVEVLPPDKMVDLYKIYRDNDVESVCKILFQQNKDLLKMNKISSFQDEYYFLSNYSVSPIVLDGVSYQNAEAAFQAGKVPVEDRNIFSNLNSTEAKKKGQEVNLRKDWEQVKVSHMEKIVRAKFEQNPELARKLVDTGGAYLEEENDWGDRIWGTVNGQGANLLGQILMKVRDDFIKEYEIDK